VSISVKIGSGEVTKDLTKIPGFRRRKLEPLQQYRRKIYKVTLFWPLLDENYKNSSTSDEI